MAKGLNKCTFIGNLGSDPKYQPDVGSGRCAFSIAVNESWRDREGNDQERTEWVHIVVWGGLAEACGKYLAKGRAVYVEGKLSTRKWEDREGNEKTSVEVVVNPGQGQVMFLGGGERQDQQPAGGDKFAPPPPPEDDIPF